MQLLESIHLRTDEFSIKALTGIRQQYLNQKKITIISNNCWAGWVYRRYGLEYQSPTIGLYMFAHDYIDFCKHFDTYLHSHLQFIPANESRYYEELIKRDQLDVPIGLLDNQIEIVFLHYSSEKEAYEKWTRRVKRVRMHNLAFKFSEMNLCTEKDIEEFDRLPYQKKVCFTANKYPFYQCCVPIEKVVKDGRVTDDTTYYADYIHLTRFLNDGVIKLNKAVQTKY